ncbi:hypothetical protein Tco_1533338 [Tanacetum coccineum]
MSNSNTNLQTQTSSALHNAIMEAGGKDRPPMLAPVPPATPDIDGTLPQPREEVMETYATVSEDTKKCCPVIFGVNGYVYFTPITYHKETMLLCKQEEAGVQLNAEQADWKDDTDDESDDQELHMEVFMDDFSVFGNSFENCLSRLEKMLQRCDDTHFVYYLGERAILWHAFRSELSTKPNWALKHANFDLSTASRDHRKVNLNDLTELQIARIVKAPCFVYSITRASNPQLHFGNPDILI